MAEPILSVSGLQAGYDESVVLSDISFSLEQGRSLALLGRNGVGKSSLFLAVMGHLRARTGAIRLDGVDVTNSKASKRTSQGIAWVPQERDCFASLTVDEHLMIAARPGAWTPDRLYGTFPNLAARKSNLGNQLSGGEQQMLAIARALVANPKVLLLDEPLEGLAPVIVEELERTIRTLMADHGLSVILIEQHPGFALGVCDDCLILERGRIAHASSSVELMECPAIIDRLVGLRKRKSES
jgi:branched-chain amino acid transport system ATP-binding protein